MKCFVVVSLSFLCYFICILNRKKIQVDIDTNRMIDEDKRYTNEKKIHIPDNVIETKCHMRDHFWQQINLSESY